MQKQNFSFELPVTITKQGHKYVAYSPVLDISTSGTSKKNVQKRFEEAVTLFLDELIEAGTTDDVLTELGWTKIQKVWNPPHIVSNNTIGINIPAFA